MCPAPVSQGKAEILALAKTIGETQRDCGVDMPVDEYLGTLKFGLVEVVYEWARGMEFAQITSLTDVAEGKYQHQAAHFEFPAACLQVLITTVGPA
jgi:superfamily II RNA helicase